MAGVIDMLILLHSLLSDTLTLRFPFEESFCSPLNPCDSGKADHTWLGVQCDLNVSQSVCHISWPSWLIQRWIHGQMLLPQIFGKRLDTERLWWLTWHDQKWALNMSYVSWCSCVSSQNYSWALWAFSLRWVFYCYTKTLPATKMKTPKS